ncbi:MAG: hypothetical protein IH605_15295 [Burkholderiales bacterium]|nr:hypothetical protein [Burkholderiales bacterium]
MEVSELRFLQQPTILGVGMCAAFFLTLCVTALQSLNGANTTAGNEVLAAVNAGDGARAKAVLVEKEAQG